MKKILFKSLFLFFAVLTINLVFNPLQTNAENVVLSNEKIIQFSNSNALTINSNSSSLSPNAISSASSTIPYMYFFLRDDSYNSITGIVVDKIEIY